MKKRKIELTLPATLKFSSLVREISTDVFDHVGFTKEWASRLKLVVDELYMNASRYASIENESKIYIEFQYDDNSISFKIDDEGAGENKMNAEQLKQKIAENKTALTDLTKTCGRGLALISDLWTDELVIADSPHGGISVYFSKKLSTEAPASPPMFAPAQESASTTQRSAPAAPKAEGEILKIVGEVDASNIDEKVKPIQDKIESMPKGGVLVIDCSELVYFNSTFIGYLANWHNALLEKEGQLVMRHANDQVREVINLVGLNHVIYMES